MDQDMPLGTAVGLGTGDIVLDGDPAAPTESGTASPPRHFSVHVYCGQTVAHLSNWLSSCFLFNLVGLLLCHLSRGSMSK